MENIPYAEAIGSLMYAGVQTRPDISFIVNSLAKYMKNPAWIHWNAVKKIFKYLKNTKNKGLFYSGSDNKLIAYCDADWAGNPENSRSISGHIIYFGGGPISWHSHTQDDVQLSSAGAEYVSLSNCITTVLWLRDLLNELGFTQNEPTPIYIDNQSAIHTATNPVTHKRAKQIRVKYHHVIREAFQKKDKEIQLCKINTKENNSDMFTKQESKIIFEKFRDRAVTELPYH